MRLPIDTSAVSFVCVLPPQSVVDYETKRPKADDNGEPLYSVSLAATAENSAEIIAVKVPASTPPAVRPGMAVKVVGLVATPWSMGDRNGVAFRATRVEPMAVQQARAS
jgi:hypothetical protein